MKRATAIAVLTLVLPGCANLGLDGAPPLEEAEHHTPPTIPAAVYEPSAETAEDVIVEGRLWVPWGTPSELDSAELRPVGSVHGLNVYARTWDRSPYDALFAQHEDEWQRYVPVIGRSGAAPAAH